MTVSNSSKSRFNGSRQKLSSALNNLEKIIEKKLKSKQISFSDLDYDDFNSIKAKKYVNNKRYSRDL